jgi:hypothetical protein
MPLPRAAAMSCCILQLVSSDVVHPFGVDSIRVCNNFMFVGMSREDEGIVKVYNLAAGGASHQLTGHKVSRAEQQDVCGGPRAAAVWLLLHCCAVSARCMHAGCCCRWTLGACWLAGVVLLCLSSS